MSREKFEEGDVWAHRYGGIPEMNAHYLVKKIEGELFLVSAYSVVEASHIDPSDERIYFCGTYSEEYFAPIFKKELDESKTV